MKPPPPIGSGVQLVKNQRKVVTLTRKWTGISCDHVSDFFFFFLIWTCHHLFTLSSSLPTFLEIPANLHITQSFQLPMTCACLILSHNLCVHNFYLLFLRSAQLLQKTLWSLDNYFQTLPDNFCKPTLKFLWSWWDKRQSDWVERHLLSGQHLQMSV